MADTKKISELNSTSNLANNDEFVVVDKNGTGADSSSSGKTSKIRFDDLKNQIGSQGEKGQKGEENKGQKGEPLEFNDLSSTQRNQIKGQKGEENKGQKGEANKGQKGEVGPKLTFNDLSTTEKTSLKGATGAKLTFNDLSSSEKTSLKGATGAKLTFNDLSSVEKTSLKGAPGAKLAFNDLSTTDKNSLKGVAGDKGTPGAKLTFNDLSSVEKASLKGIKGEIGIKGLKGVGGRSGNSNAHLNFADYTLADGWGDKHSIITFSDDGVAFGAKKLSSKTQDYFTYARRALTGGCTLEFVIPSASLNTEFAVGLVEQSDIGAWIASAQKNDSMPGVEGSSSGIQYFRGFKIFKSNFVTHSGRGISTGNKALKSGMRLSVKYVGNEIQWYENGALLHTSGPKEVGSGKKYYVCISIDNSSLTSTLKWLAYNLSFTSVGASGLKGEPGASGVVGGTVTNEETGASMTVGKDHIVVKSAHGNVRIGAENTSHCHFYTDRGSYYFNKTMYVNGPIKDYATNATYYHAGNLPSFVELLPISYSGPDYKAPSSRRVDPHSGNPTNEHYAMSTFGNAGNVTGQLATHFQTGQLYSRGFNSTWSGWKKYLSNVGSQTINGQLNIGADADLVLQPSTSGGNANIVLFKNAAAHNHGGPGSGKVADREHFRVHSTTAGSHTAAAGVPQGNNEGLLRPAFMVCDQLYFQNGKDLRTGSGGAGPVGTGGIKGCMGWNGDFHVQSTFISNYSFSDERLKKNISNLDSKKSLDQINSLQGVNYEWKEGREGVQFGFIAQQVEKVLPEMISKHSRLGDGEDGQLDQNITWKKIREKQIVPLLVESVKELTDLIKKQQTQIDELKSKIS